MASAFRRSAEGNIAPIHDYLTQRASQLFGSEAEPAVAQLFELTAQADSESDLADLEEFITNDLAETAGLPAATLLGASGEFNAQVSEIVERREGFHKRYPAVGRTLGVIGTGSGATSALMGLADGEVSAADGIDVLRTGLDLYRYRDGAPVGILKLADSYLGAVGAGFGFASAAHEGDVLGMASSSVAAYAALTGNPFLAAGAVLFDVGRSVWEAAAEAHEQGKVNERFLREVGFSQEVAEQMTEVLPPDLEVLFYAAEGIMQEDPSLTLPQAIEHFFATSNIELARPYFEFHENGVPIYEDIASDPPEWLAGL